MSCEIGLSCNVPGAPSRGSRPSLAPAAASVVTLMHTASKVGLAWIRLERGVCVSTQACRVQSGCLPARTGVICRPNSCHPAESARRAALAHSQPTVGLTTGCSDTEQFHWHTAVDRVGQGLAVCAGLHAKSYQFARWCCSAITFRPSSAGCRCCSTQRTQGNTITISASLFL